MITSQTACEVSSEIDIIRRCQTDLAGIQIGSKNKVASHIFLHGVYQTSKARVDILLTRHCPSDIEVIARLVACVALLYQLRQRDLNLVDSLAILLAFCHALNRQEHVLGFTRFDFDKVVRQVRRYSSHGNDTLELVLFFSVKLSRINIAEGNLLVLQLKVAAIFFKVSQAARIQLISQLGF